ncbi:hypothetical protein [Ruminiclostridium papyrosolvens]|uniref:Uncharacterized protein n=1 Tax=Ruminiclostridium papyrosolvens C7 TaxID=1330534 RepID=U4QXF2_9FIRM|nr:hypothetical protein [Ruminiclostridium papyrosolvens]EPR09214.1 hypothetical protein L323_16765 [Ruminiclostridium papyrosolvens C7]
MNKILRLGSLFFSMVLLVFGIIRIMSGRENSGVFYLIAAVGFYIIYFSYKRSQGKD